MGIEQRQFLVCRDSSIRSSRTRTGSVKKGRGRTGSTGPHAGDGARVEAKTQNSHDWYRSYGNKQIPSGALPLSDSFFFQAEDGIRDLTVTGVTCALPI